MSIGLNLLDQFRPYQLKTIQTNSYNEIRAWRGAVS